jgi:menaquinone-dependent protoporphyrinogen IX oxidase
MKTLILYTSKTGSTEKYAKDIASAVGGDAFPLKHFKWKLAENYDIIVYGGWIMGGTIQGLDNFFQNWDKYLSKKQVIIFSTGMTLPTADGRHLLIEQNLLDMYHVRFYQVRGSFDFSKLSFFYKLAIKNSIRMMAKDPDITEGQKSVLDIENHPLEVYDGEKIEKICTVIRSLLTAPTVVEVDSK